MTTWTRGFGVAVACTLALTGCAGQPSVDTSSAAAANANLGADYLRKNQIERARTYFQKALDYDDDDFSANWGMAVVNDRRGDTDRARDFYDKALRLRTEPSVENSYGAFLCRQGETKNALGYFKRAAGAPAYDGRAGALANAGLCLYRAGRRDAAADYFRRALAVDAKQPTALTRMAAIEYARKRYLDARAFLQRADAVTALTSEQLRLGARIENALGDRAAALAYRQRYRAGPGGVAVSAQPAMRTAR